MIATKLAAALLLFAPLQAQEATNQGIVGHWTLDLDLLTPPLPVGVDSLSLVAQSVVISPALEILLGSPSTLVVLNQGL